MPDLLQNILRAILSLAMVPPIVLVLRLLRRWRKRLFPCFLLAVLVLGICLISSHGIYRNVQEVPSAPVIQAETVPENGEPPDSVSSPPAGSPSILLSRLSFWICCIWLGASCALLLYSLLSFLPLHCRMGRSAKAENRP